MRMTRLLLLACISAVALAASIAATVAGGPAVSDINGKITPYGGSFSSDGENDTGVGGLEGSLTMPLGHSFGIQFDGAYARMSDDDFWSSGAHLFWRDPDVGMLGVYTGYSWLDQAGGIDVGIVALEAQRFSGRFTLDGRIGYVFADGDDVFGSAKLDYYPTEDLMLSAGYAYELNNKATIGAEYQFTTSNEVGTALFANASAGEDSSYSVLGGLRVFLGENMTLINRHRKQDPPSYTPVGGVMAGQIAAAIAPLAVTGGNICVANTCYPQGHLCSCPSGSSKKPGSFDANKFSCDTNNCLGAHSCGSWTC